MAKKRWDKPKTDNALLADISFIVFVVRFNYRVVEKKWPLITKAFHNFDIKKLAKLDENELDSFMKAEGMIKNKWKMSAVIRNAKICAQIQNEHGSVLKWVEKAKREYKKSPLLAPELRSVFRIFRGIGPMTSTWLESLFLSDKSYVEYEIG